MIRATAALMAALLILNTVIVNAATLPMNAAQANEAGQSGDTSQASEEGQTSEAAKPDETPKPAFRAKEQPDIPEDSAAGRKIVQDGIIIREAVEEIAQAVIREQEKAAAAAGAAGKTELDESMKELRSVLEEELEKQGGSWSLYLKKVDDGQEIGIHETDRMVAASLIKLYIAGAFYTECERGRMNADSYGDIPDIMLSRSDNDAANRLITDLGMAKINLFIRRWAHTSDPKTILNRKMLVNNGMENYTSARDCGLVLEQVLRGQYVSQEASARILDDLEHQERRGKIPSGVPADVRTANKTGELTGVENDAAIIWGPDCTYILCIMSRDSAGAYQEIGKLSRIIYDSLCNKQEDVVK